jgi:hypothetical protein
MLYAWIDRTAYQYLEEYTGFSELEFLLTRNDIVTYPHGRGPS